VWKLILQIQKDYPIGKWSRNWEGPCIISGSVPGNAYMLKEIYDEELGRAY
jgi:hypothetical protein